MIKTINITQDKALINGCVTIWFADGKMKSAYDKKLISEDDAIILINEYIKILREQLC